MDSPDHGGAGISVTSIIIILLTLGTIYIDLPPLKGSRPQEPALALPGLRYGEADARLWQDPFTAVTAHEQRLRKDVDYEGAASSPERAPAAPGAAAGAGPSGVPAASTDAALAMRGCETLANASLTIGVAVFGGRYFESIESRRRTRYAVVSALASRGYYPDNPQQIKYLRAEGDLDSDRAPRILPYEIFRGRISATGERGPFQPVFVLWLDDDWLAESSVSGFVDLSSRVLERECSGALHGPWHHPPPRVLPAGADDFRHIEASQAMRSARSWTDARPDAPTPANLRLLGPAGSTSLKSLLGNRKWQTADGDLPVRIFSYSATVSENRLQDKYINNVDGPIPVSNTHEHSLRAALWRTIATDEKLAWTMIEELTLRRIDPVKESDRVVLISEMDTFYAQELPEAFGEMLCKRWAELPRAERVARTGTDRCDDWLGEQLIRMTYLRGMDGQIADGTKSGASIDSAKDDSASSQGASESEPSSVRATGRHQFDYLHRLAQRLRAMERRLNGSDQSIKAIGILGSDVYDKLLVLRALRPHFPRTIFFTTDLDATLFSEDQIKWTRNLVVVSSFGLSLHPALQKGVPPFRDSYQTSAFLSTLFAIEGVDATLGAPDGWFNRKSVEALFAPRIFEIGRGGAYELKPANSIAAPALPRVQAETTSRSAERRVQPTPIPAGKAIYARYNEPVTTSEPVSLIHNELPSPAQWAWELARISIVLALFVVLIRSLTSNESVFAAVTRSMKLGSWPATRWIQLAAFALVATAFVAVLSLWIKEGFEGEPLYWTAGISIWPTELIRLLTIFLVVFLVCVCWTRQKRNEAEIEEDFALAMPPTPATDEKSADSGECPAAWTFAGVRNRVMRCYRGLDAPWKDLYELRPASKAPVDVEVAWQSYMTKRSFRFTAIRVMFTVAAFMVFGRAMVALFGQPHVPARGDVSFLLDKVIIFSLVPCFLTLNFLVADITRRSSEICMLLGKRRSLWPAKTMERVGRGGRAEDGYLSEWIDVRFVARLTENVSSFIYYPFLVLFILVISRSNYFDAWGTSWSLGLIFLASGLYALGSAIVLERTARTVRRECLSSLQLELVAARERAKEGESAVSQIEWLINDIRTTRQGAFAPVFQQPVVRTMLGIAGSVALLVAEKMV